MIWSCVCVLIFHFSVGKYGINLSQQLFILAICFLLIDHLLLNSECGVPLSLIFFLVQTKCFICGIGSEYFDTVPHGFETHTLQEHNLANYL